VFVANVLSLVFLLNLFSQASAKFWNRHIPNDSPFGLQSLLTEKNLANKLETAPIYSQSQGRKMGSGPGPNLSYDTLECQGAQLSMLGVKSENFFQTGILF